MAQGGVGGKAGQRRAVRPGQMQRYVGAMTRHRGGVSQKNRA